MTINLKSKLHELWVTTAHIMVATVAMALFLLTQIGCEDQGADPMSPTIPSNPGLQLSAPNHDFGKIITGESGSFSLILTNSGDIAYQIITVDDDYIDSSLFTTDFDNLTGTNLSPDSSVTVQITFNPTMEQAYSANLLITTSDTAIGQVSVSLSGEGVNALTWSNVSPILQASCVACHGVSGNYSVETYAQTLLGNRIIPGDPDNSLLIQRLEGTVAPSMPFGLAPLLDTQIGTIRSWIEQGAPND